MLKNQKSQELYKLPTIVKVAKKLPSNLWLSLLTLVTRTNVTLVRA